MAQSTATTASDLAGSGAAANRVIAKTAASGTLATGTIAKSTGTYTWYGFTPAGDPGTTGITGNYTFEINMTTGSTNTGSMVCTLIRVNSAGTVQTTGSTSTVSNMTTGKKTFSWTAANLGTWASGDRLSIKCLISNTATSTASLTMTFGGQGSNRLLTPWDPNINASPEDVSFLQSSAFLSTSLNSTTAPDGTTTADSVLSSDATANNGDYIQNQFLPAWVNGNTVVHSCFIKATGAANAGYLQMGAGGTSIGSVNFDLSAVTATAGSATGGTVNSVGIQAASGGGGGWYRVWYKATVSTGIGAGSVFGIDNVSAGVAVGVGFYKWGDSIELGTTLSDYPGVTMASTVYVLKRPMRSYLRR